MSDRYDKLRPKDLVITLRSLPRRFEAAVGPVQSDPELFPRIDEPGPDGRSLGETVSTTAQRLVLVGAEIERAVVRDNAVVSAAIVSDSGAAPAERLPLERATASIEGTAEGLAALLDRQNADSWARRATLDTGGTIDLIALVRLAAREGVEGLRATERQVDRLRQG
jgi:hypothetical protein